MFYVIMPRHMSLVPHTQSNGVVEARAGFRFCVILHRFGPPCLRTDARKYVG